MGRSPDVTTRGAVAAIISLGCVTGCDTLPFRSDARHGRAVLGFGAPAPYVDGPRPPAHPGPPGPMVADPAVRPAGGHGTGPGGPGGHGAAGPPAGPDLYAATRRDMPAAAVRDVPERVYVPGSGAVRTIAPRTFQVTGRVRAAPPFRPGPGRRSVVPSHDLRTLWVTDEAGGTLTPVSARTGRARPPVRVAGPTAVYFTPDGRRALVMAAGAQRIDVRHPRTMRALAALPVRCAGLGYADFTPDGSALVASCDRSGRLLRLDLRSLTVTGTLRLPPRSAPQDVRTAPDGRFYYVADKARHGLWLVDAARFRPAGFVPTGRGAQSLALSRDGAALYVANRRDGSISVLSHATRRVVRTWRLPAGDAPEVGGVSADGNVLWLADRAAATVLAVSTWTGTLLRRIPVGRDPGGLCVFPQPGRFSYGPAGRYR